mmetsp:Transcript_11203/g.17596  ORF Transcript_11203/g.17596 Transcript_11203/m.17596 type:complete len:203 (+) Transcript_11203:694-1302(+)
MMVMDLRRANRSMSSYDKPPSVQCSGAQMRGSSSIMAALAWGTKLTLSAMALAYSALRKFWSYLASSFQSAFSYPGIWWFLMNISRALSKANSGRSPLATYLGRWSFRKISWCFFCQALMSDLPLAGLIIGRGPKAGSSSILFTISKDSFITSLRYGISRIGATFFPISLVGVSTSSFDIQRRSCFTFLRPKIMRALTQNGQ